MEDQPPRSGGAVNLCVARHRIRVCSRAAALLAALDGSRILTNVDMNGAQIIEHMLSIRRCRPRALENRRASRRSVTLGGDSK
jgi:hypothetical protein